MQESRLGHQRGSTWSPAQIGAGWTDLGQIWKKGTAGSAVVVTCVVRRRQLYEGRICQAERTACSKALSHSRRVFTESPD